MAEATVTVVLATFNGASHLWEQLQSIADQTVPPLELVVSDDGSTDSTLEMARRFQSDAPFPVILLANTERLGYAGNFMRGFAAASGRFVAFCDQDDVWEPSKLEHALDAMRDERVGLFAHTATLIDEQGHRVGSFRQGILRPRLLEPCSSDPWGVYYGFSVVVRRELITALDWRDRGAHTFEGGTLLSHDLWCYFVATSLSHAALSTAALARYRRHTTNATPPVRWSLRRFTSTMGLAADGAVSRSSIAHHREDLLRDLRDRCQDERLAQRADVASRYWAGIAQIERGRDALYAGSGRATRAGSWLRLIRTGAYAGQGRGSLTIAVGIKDLLAGVLRVRRRR